MVAFAISVLTCVFISCDMLKSTSSSSGNDNKTTTYTKKNNKDLVKLDWYINFQWYARHWGDSQVSKYITDKTGVDINFVVPAGNEGEKLNSLMAGNELPDYITLGWWEGQVNALIDKGKRWYKIEDTIDKLKKSIIYNMSLIMKKSGNEELAHKMIIENIVI